MSGILISLTGNQNIVHVFFVKKFPELSSSNVTYITSFMCLFMCKRHFNHCYVICVENNSRKKLNRKTHAKKAQAYFGSQSKISRFQTSSTKPTVPNYIMSFSNCAQRFTGSKCGVFFFKLEPP